jgi:hypothetical protein
MAETVKRKKRKPLKASASLVSTSVKKSDNKEGRKVIMKDEAVEENNVVHPAKKRRDARKLVTGNDINSMVEALRNKIGGLTK